MRFKRNEKKEQAQARREIIYGKLRRLAEVDALADTANRAQRKQRKQVDALIDRFSR